MSTTDPPPTPVPVLMYHSVGRVMPDWDWSILTVPWWTFEDHLRWLRRSGHTGASLRDLYAHVEGSRRLAGKPVVLTFDDGYLDNWVYVAPLLERYGFTGTVCVSPEFVDPRDVVRPTLADVWAGRVREEELETRGFMSWGELRAAVAKGLLTIESHALTHTWYPTGPDVVDFHHPGDGHYWLDWNAHPDGKPFYLKAPAATKVPWGYPVYEHEKSLAATRYFPDPGEAEGLTAFVREHGGSDFFATPGWRDALLGRLREVRGESGAGGRYETADERRARYSQELEESRRVIVERLGTDVQSMFWPGGGYTEEALDLALGIYQSVTWSRLDRWSLFNRPGEDPRKVSRRGVPFVETRRYRVHTGGRYLTWFLDEYRGSLLARRKRQVLKLSLLAGVTLGVWPLRRDERIALHG